MNKDTGHKDQIDIWERMHTQLMEYYGVETEAWAVERIARVQDALQAGRPAETRLQCEILWIPEMNAFIAPGRYIYFSRELLQRTASDDSAAFIVAHELAHHDLGHTDLFRGWLSHLSRLPSAELIACCYRGLENQFLRPEQEYCADALALAMCLDAGYDGRKCLEVFDILEMDAIDHGALDSVFGSEEMIQLDKEQTLAGWVSQFREWSLQRLAGHPPVRKRKETLLKYLELAESSQRRNSQSGKL